jgi:hypothetical protein
MLYRLSYVGAIDRSFQPGSTMQREMRYSECCTRSWKRYPGDLGGRDTITRRGSLIAKATG